MSFYRTDNSLSYHHKKHKFVSFQKKIQKILRAFTYHVNEKIFYINTIKDNNYPSQEGSILYIILFE